MAHVDHSPAASPIAVEQQLRRLEANWIAEVGHLSSTKALIAHPDFQAIVVLGDAVVPFLLQDLAQRPRLWVWALPEITGDDPVSPADRGDMAKMTATWLQWGRERGYQC